MATSSNPTTPVKVPKAIAAYQPSTQDPGLRSDINNRLLNDGHISKIHDHLLHALHASPQNWPTLIQSHALSLLRSGEITTFPELLNRVLGDIRADTLAQRTGEININGSGSGSNSVGKNGKGSAASGTSGKGEGGASLALPRKVVEEGVRVTRECLEGVCEVVD